MYRLFDKETNQLVGELTDEQMQFLFDELEEESPRDTDYYMNAPTVDMLEEDGADPQLVATLRRALGGREEVDLRWERS